MGFNSGGRGKSESIQMVLNGGNRESRLILLFKVPEDQF